MKYWAAFSIFLAVWSSWAAGISWLILGANPLLVALLAGCAYTALVLLDVLPPGVRREQVEDEALLKLHGGPHEIVMSGGRVFDPRIAATLALQSESRSQPAAGYVRGQRGASVTVEEPRKVPESPRVWGAVAMGCIVGVVAVALLVGHFNGAAEAPSELFPLGAARGGTDGQGAAGKTDRPGGSAAVAVVTSTPAETPTPPPTEAPSPTPTATQEPPTPTATPPPPTPTPRPPTPTPTVGPAAGTAIVAGRWTLTDTVTSGSDAGSTFTFDITLSQAGAVITGGGGGLTIRGTVSGNRVSATFTRAGGTGAFSWIVQADGSLAGTFIDPAAGNSGTSVAVR